MSALREIILHEGHVEKLIQHEAKLNAVTVFPLETNLSGIFPIVYKCDRCFNWLTVHVVSGTTCITMDRCTSNSVCMNHCRSVNLSSIKNVEQ